MIQTIKKILASIWDSIKKVFKAIVNFAKDIKNWFIAKYQRILKKYPNAKPLALRIQKDLEEGNFNTVDLGLEKDTIVKVFYDEKAGEIIEDEVEALKYNELDEETKNNFGDKELIVFS